MDELNRDLLVAVLAVLTDAIPRHALSMALSAWAKDRQKSLAEILLADGSIDPERLQALHCLAESHLLRHQNDLRVSLNAWNAVGVTQEVLTEISDAALTTTLGVAMGTGETLPAGPSTDDGLAETIPAPDRPSDGTGDAPAPSGGERFRRSGRMPRAGSGRSGWPATRAAARGRPQGDPGPVTPTRGPAGAVPARGRDHRAARAPRDRPGLRPGPRRRRPARTTRCGSSAARASRRRSSSSTRGAGERTPAAAADVDVGRRVPAAARPVPRRLRRDRLRPQPGRAAPRPQAGQHHARPLRRDAGRRLGPGQGDRPPRHRPRRGRGDGEPTLPPAVRPAARRRRMPGTAIGTPAYMSPEQAARRARRARAGAATSTAWGRRSTSLLTGQVAVPGENDSANVLQRGARGRLPAAAGGAPRGAGRRSRRSA